MLPMKRRPTHPGEMLREDFLRDFGMTASGFAKAIGMSRRTATELLHERRGVSPKMALCLSRLFGTSPEFWLNAQRNVDLWNAFQRNRKMISRIIPANPPGTRTGTRSEYDFKNGVRGKYAERFSRDRARANELDSMIIDREAERLNKNAREVLAYQVAKVVSRAAKSRQGWAKRFRDANRNERAGKPARKDVHRG